MNGGELVAGRAGVGPPPWRWIIYDRNEPDEQAAVRGHGVQHTRLYASPGEIAAERLAEQVFRALQRGAAREVASLVCRVKRDGAPRWAGHASGEVWARRLAGSPTTRT
ncbi:hypothetical protein ACGFIY_21485 [Micromonospora chersina]|uniref:hypothetical protein n=1 Tax=Micromonospora chersina TaxID=47854 RepID=UPI0037223D9B